MNNLLLFSICYVSDICNHLRIFPFWSFGFCPGCLLLGLFFILLTAEPLLYRATHSSTVPLYHFLKCQLITASLLRTEGCFHLPVSPSPSYIAYASSSIFFPLHLALALERWKRRGGVDVELEKDGKCDPSLDVSSSVKRASAGCP